MGCKSHKSLPEKENSLISSIKDIIERDGKHLLLPYLEQYSLLISTPSSILIDSDFISLREITLSPLAYSLWIGRSVSFSHLLDLGASFTKMEELYQSKHLSPIKLICERGFTDILRIYLQHYLEKIPTNLTDTQNLSVVSDKAHDNFSQVFTYTAIAIACDLEWIGILNLVHEYYKGKEAPRELDIHYVDRTTGDNCALIACRTGNLALIKLMFEKIKANFHMVNYRNQGALMVMAEAALQNPGKEYFPCLVYLVEVVKIDVQFRVYETLEILKDKKSVAYIEERLRAIIFPEVVDYDSIKNMKEYENFSKLTDISQLFNFEEPAIDGEDIYEREKA